MADSVENTCRGEQTVKPKFNISPHRSYPVSHNMEAHVRHYHQHHQYTNGSSTNTTTQILCNACVLVGGVHMKHNRENGLLAKIFMQTIAGVSQIRASTTSNKVHALMKENPFERHLGRFCGNYLDSSMQSNVPNSFCKSGGGGGGGGGGGDLQAILSPPSLEVSPVDSYLFTK
uniref:Uncharacterized protein n=1 Tax=Glossina austeni TaxID=7395 RepID=A0A1A9VHM1_GLOAU